MKTTLKLLLTALLVPVFLGTLNAQPEKQTRYLSFQIFTYGPNPQSARMGEGNDPIAGFPDKATLRDYIEDIKRRVGTVGDGQTRLAVTLGPLSFDHTDAEVTKFIELGFELALETDVAVGFHIDDSMFWTRRKDLWSDPNNIEALDWDGTPNTGRTLNWKTAPGSKPDRVPPQMCFNSKVIVREVQQRSALMGKAIQAGVVRLQQRKRPELFAGVIAGWETMIGQDFETGKYLGYRALLNRGFTREHPPADMDLEREKVVQEFVELWAKGFADAGVSQQKIYSHIAPFPRRAFNSGGSKEITYSQHSHFAITRVAFGKYHQPGFSTYPTPFRFDDIYEELDKHKQAAWASSEGTNLQLGAGPGQSGMTMETYLAKMFNHGATLVNVYSWGLGGEANKNMSFRVVTEGEEALGAYRKFLKGDPLIEGQITLTLLDRLPPKIHKIQEELPAWIKKTGDTEPTVLMQRLQEQLKGKYFEEAEKTADAILKLMGENRQAATEAIRNQNGPVVASERVAGGSGSQIAQSPAAGSGPLSEDNRKRLTAKIERVKEGADKWLASGRDLSAIHKIMEEKVKPLLDTGKFMEAEAELDRVLDLLKQDGKETGSPTGSAEALHERVSAKVELMTMAAEKWLASGRDLSAIQQIMEEKIKPLLDTGKFVEAEAELDRVLDLLKQDGKKTESPADPTEAVHQRVSAKLERVRLGMDRWSASGRDLSAIRQIMEEKVKPLLDTGKFMEAEAGLDRVLDLLKQDGKETGSPANPTGGLQERVSAKVDLVTKGAGKWAASGRDLSLIQQIMEVNVKPLLDTGRLMEAEAELDGVLDLLNDGKNTESQQRVPEEVRKHIRHKLDSSFVVYRDKVQEELKLTTEQKEKLEEALPDAMQFFETIKALNPEEQEKELRAYRPKAHERLAALLKETLNEGQRARLRQIERQRDQLFDGEVWKELQITDEQQKQFMPLIQETQKKINALMQEIQKGGSPGEIQPKVLKSRADLEGQLEALLTDAQKSQWKEMLGKPMALADIFDM